MDLVFQHYMYLANIKQYELQFLPKTETLEFTS